MFGYSCRKARFELGEYPEVFCPIAWFKPMIISKTYGVAAQSGYGR